MLYVLLKKTLAMFRALGKSIGLLQRLSSPNQLEFYVAIGNVELSASALQLAAARASRKSPRWSLGGLNMWDHVVNGSLMSQVTERWKLNIFQISSTFLIQRWGTTIVRKNAKRNNHKYMY